MDAPTVAIIILSLNQREKTLRCLQSLVSIPNKDVKLILWDNGSADETIEVVRERYPDVYSHYCDQNLGVAGGRNKAAQLANDLYKPQFLLFIDNDMTVEPDFLTHLLAPFASESRLAQTTGKILDMANPKRIYGAGGCQIRFWLGDTNHKGYGEIDGGQYQNSHACICSGGCMLIRTDIFEAMDGFDKRFNPYGPEDLDMGLRIQKAGFYGLYIPEAVVYHESHPGRTFSGGSYSQQYAANRARQWLRFLKRHGKWWQKLAFYGAGGPYLLLKLIIREYRRDNLGPALKGISRGVLGQ